MDLDLLITGLIVIVLIYVWGTIIGLTIEFFYTPKPKQKRITKQVIKE